LEKKQDRISTEGGKKGPPQMKDHKGATQRKKDDPNWTIVPESQRLQGISHVKKSQGIERRVDITTAKSLGSKKTPKKNK